MWVAENCREPGSLKNGPVFCSPDVGTTINPCFWRYCCVNLWLVLTQKVYCEASTRHIATKMRLWCYLWTGGFLDVLIAGVDLSTPHTKQRSRKPEFGFRAFFFVFVLFLCSLVRFFPPFSRFSYFPSSFPLTSNPHLSDLRGKIREIDRQTPTNSHTRMWDCGARQSISKVTGYTGSCAFKSE